MNVLLFAGTGLFFVGLLIGVLQLWFMVFSHELFIKIEVTLGVLIVVLLGIWFVAREYIEDQKNRHESRLD